MTSRDERARELEELARKREAYWDRRWEQGRRKRAVAVTLLLVLWFGFLVAYWFMLEPSRRGDVILIGLVSAIPAAINVWRIRRRQSSDDPP